MKYRKGFVTNSSSSSFIIGKKEDTTSVDDVFHLIQDMYKEMVAKSKEYIDYCKKQRKKSKLYPYVENGYLRFETPNWDVRKNIEAELSQLFGLDVYDVYCEDEEIPWLSFNSYDEYLQYFIKKIKKNPKDYHNHAPFSIAEMSNPYPIFVHNNHTEPDTDMWGYNEVFEWYCPCKCVNGISNCDTCEDAKYCDDEIQKKIKENSEETDPITILGRVCVYSECGYIPQFVVDKLAEISEFYCNHMG